MPCICLTTKSPSRPNESSHLRDFTSTFNSCSQGTLRTFFSDIVQLVVLGGGGGVRFHVDHDSRRLELQCVTRGDHEHYAFGRSGQIILCERKQSKMKVRNICCFSLSFLICQTLIIIDLQVALGFADDLCSCTGEHGSVR